jgi:hypothetical protein
MLIFYDSLHLVHHAPVELVILAFLHIDLLVPRIPLLYRLFCERDNLGEIGVKCFPKLIIRILFIDVLQFYWCLRNFKEIFLDRLKVLDVLFSRPFAMFQFGFERWVHTLNDFFILREFSQESHWFLEQYTLVKKLITNLLLHSYTLSFLNIRRELFLVLSILFIGIGMQLVQNLVKLLFFLLFFRSIQLL